MTHMVSIDDFVGYTAKTVVCSCNTKQLVMLTDPVMNRINYKVIDKTNKNDVCRCYEGDSFRDAINDYNNI